MIETTSDEAVQQNANAAHQPITSTPPGSGWLGRSIVPLILLLFIVFFSFYEPTTFRQYRTVQVLLSTQSALGVLAIAAIFPLIVGEFDLSLGATLGMSVMATAKASAVFNLNPVLAILIGLATGAFIGLVNGLLATKLHIGAVIATLGTSVVLDGLANWWSSGGQSVIITSKSLLQFGQGSAAGIPLPAIYLAIIAVLALFCLEFMPLGRLMRVVGASPRAALLIGLKVDRIKILGFVGGGLLAGAAGILTVTAIGSATAGVGDPELLPAYAAAFVGMTCITPGRFNVIGVIFAVFLIAVGSTGLQLMGAPPVIEQIFDGVALVLAVGVSARLRRGQIEAA